MVRYIFGHRIAFFFILWLTLEYIFLNVSANSSMSDGAQPSNWIIDHHAPEILPASSSATNQLPSSSSATSSDASDRQSSAEETGLSGTVSVKKYLSLSVRAAMQVRVQSRLRVCHLILDWSVTIYCLPLENRLYELLFIPLHWSEKIAKENNDGRQLCKPLLHLLFFQWNLLHLNLPQRQDCGERKRCIRTDSIAWKRRNREARRRHPRSLVRKGGRRPLSKSLANISHRLL